ncbi:MAG TPA: hypothetical protein VI916_11565 [Acidimicrobiia bacterium]|nr:hypothetical protein [Acidimicrobiia bacterium]
MNLRTAHPFRRTAIVMVAALAATVGSVALSGFANAKDEFVAGSGKAKSSILRIGPSSASLSFAPSVGVALADHLGVLGRGESLILDYAALDGTMQDDVPPLSCGNAVRERAPQDSIPPTCGAFDPKGKQIPSLRVESTEEGSSAGREQRALPTVVQRARADTRPFGFSSMELEAFDIPGIIHIAAGRADAYSGNIEIATGSGKQVVRQAGGTVDIGEVVIGSDTIGKLTVKGLHWEAFQRTDSNDDSTPEVVGEFTFGSMTILDPSGGVQQFAGPTASQITGGLPQQMKDGIAEFSKQTGIHVLIPQLATTGGVARLTPLRIALIESPVGQQVFGPIQEGAAPVRNSVTQQWLEGCSAEAGDDAGNCGLPFLVADMAIGPVAGGGRLDLELGGITGFTEGQVFNTFDFDFSAGGGFDVPALPAASSNDFDVDDSPAVLGASATNTDPVPTVGNEQAFTPAPTPQAAPAPRPFKLTGSRASAAWAVGLVGLGAALTMAAADYRRLRTRRRLITPIS